MYEPISSTYLVPFDGRFEISEAATLPSQRLRKKVARKLLKEQVALLDGLQRRLAAADKHSVLLIFQALDAAGKDGTIRALTRGIDSAGTRVSSFKAPSAEERDHDFLWRCVRRLPERGCIGVFNRSYYEEVLVVRVHPEFLGGQRVDVPDDLSELWEERYESIRAHEKHLAESGTLLLKFWLNVSRDEQARRFLSRIDEPQKRWKFSAGDLEERRRWPDYMTAFEDALRATSRPWAPWYAIPADHKPTMRAEVARIVVAALDGLDPQYPVLPDEQAAQLPGYAAQLRAELEGGANAPSRHGDEGLVRLSGEEDGGEHPRHPADARE